MTGLTASTLVFIDPSIEAHEHLSGGVKPGGHVVLLDTAHDGIAQITAALAQCRDVEQIHIVSHGQAGSLQLGSTCVDGETLQHRASELRQWASSLAAQARILLYGCQVAATQIGEQFVTTIAALTGAEVNASKTLMGHRAQGGNWSFEFATGTAADLSAIAFEPTALDAFPGVLVTELFREDFAGSDVDARPWIFGAGSNTSAGPFLTARTGVAPSVTPDGVGLPGAPTALDADGDGALRLTGNQSFQSAFVIYDRPIASTQGLQITFEFYAYNSTTGDIGADGISFFLIDGAASPTVAGGYGGSLGYANITPGSEAFAAEEGIVGGYVGIGFDEFGNFSNPNEDRVGGIGFTPDSIAIRGSQSQGYRYLKGTQDLGDLDSPTVTDRDTAKQTARVTLTNNGLLSVSLDLNKNNVFEDNEVVIQPFDLAKENGQVLPTSFKFGFAASTGGRTNIHEVRNLLITTNNDLPLVTSTSLSVLPGNAIQLTGLSATDLDGTVPFVALLALPPADQGTLFLGNPNAGGTAITALTDTSSSVSGPFFRLTPDQLNQLFFVSTGTFSGITLSYTAVDNLNEASLVPGQITVAPLGGPPPEGNTPPVVTDTSLTIDRGQSQRLTNLSATDSDGTVAFVALLSLPNPAQGTLFLRDPNNGGVAITELNETSPLVSGPFYRLTTQQLGRLFFRSTSGLVQNANLALNYVAVDNENAVSNIGNIVIQITATGGEIDERCEPGDTINGTTGNDTLRGAALADTLFGLAGDDTLQGRGCDDVLRGGLGNDTLDGGLGDDRLRAGRGNDGLFGRKGSDILRGNLGNDLLRGGGNTDQLFGGAGDDVIAGNAGDDTLRGGLGNDSLDGGLGNDRLRAGRGSDRLFGRRGADILRGNLGEDTVRGGGGDDRLFGGGGDDVIVGGPGNDFVRGRFGNDRIIGNFGDDELRGGLGDDRIVGLDGNDLLRGGRGNDRLFGRRGDDVIFGNDTNDLLRGARGNDVLDGGDGDDRLNGGVGNDVLIGGLGSDILIGRSGINRFTYTRLTESGDTIVDFKPNQDVIDLSVLFAKPRYQAANPFAQFIRLQAVTGGIEVRIDRNGNQPGRDFRTLALLEGLAAGSVGASNFVL